MIDAAATYDADRHAWAFEQAGLLRDGRAAELDAEHLAGELEALAIGELREMRARLVILVGHLMKWQRVPDLAGPAWAATIDEQRRVLRGRLAESPSLRPQLVAAIPRAHRRATRRAALETGYPRDHFPWTPAYAIDDMLDDAFWPAAD